MFIFNELLNLLNDFYKIYHIVLTKANKSSLQHEK